MNTNKKLTLAFTLSLIGFATTNSPTVAAQTHCHDFEKPAVGTVYEVGETLNVKHADINVLRFINGINIGDAIVTDLNIIDDAQPSLLVRTATVQVLPDQRVQRVTLNYAENVPPVDNPQNWNLGANGSLLEWGGTLSEQDDETLGQAANGGRVSVSVVESVSPSSGWVEGTLTLESDPVNPALPNRGISRFEIGRTSQLLLDNVCYSL